MASSSPKPGEASSSSKPGPTSNAFPRRLYELLNNEDPSIVMWTKNGQAFRVMNTARFCAEVLPKYFRHQKLTSFQRQLNLYGFHHVTKGPAAGCYFHSLFRRGYPEGLEFIKRTTRTTRKKEPREAASLSAAAMGGGSDDMPGQQSPIVMNPWHLPMYPVPPMGTFPISEGMPQAGMMTVSQVAQQQHYQHQLNFSTMAAMMGGTMVPLPPAVVPDHTQPFVAPQLPPKFDPGLVNHHYPPQAELYDSPHLLRQPNPSLSAAESYYAVPNLRAPERAASGEGVQRGIFATMAATPVGGVLDGTPAAAAPAAAAAAMNISSEKSSAHSANPAMGGGLKKNLSVRSTTDESILSFSLSRNPSNRSLLSTDSGGAASVSRGSDVLTPHASFRSVTSNDSDGSTVNHALNRLRLVDEGSSRSRPKIMKPPEDERVDPADDLSSIADYLVEDPSLEDPPIQEETSLVAGSEGGDGSAASSQSGDVMDASSAGVKLISGLFPQTQTRRRSENSSNPATDPRALKRERRMSPRSQESLFGHPPASASAEQHLGSDADVNSAADYGSGDGGGGVAASSGSFRTQGAGEEAAPSFPSLANIFGSVDGGVPPILFSEREREVGRVGHKLLSRRFSNSSDDATHERRHSELVAVETFERMYRTTPGLNVSPYYATAQRLVTTLGVSETDALATALALIGRLLTMQTSTDLRSTDERRRSSRTHSSTPMSRFNASAAGSPLSTTSRSSHHEGEGQPSAPLRPVGAQQGSSRRNSGLPSPPVPEDGEAGSW
eukprot:CAMPEP_0118991694 /NCGR_PEP_ID=MMETSP1173-20130426/52135_1 /TAXON_ID=1034831 /ORGANISM="Rhizochromulina marina cf, Strain CCMP1243" /LENGTH=778 /DNA_ID=CAMNT_0006942837 /DNA_START=103 /DNA_END=2436 /DNA_ORIENTATION=+